MLGPSLGAAAARQVLSAGEVRGAAVRWNGSFPPAGVEGGPRAVKEESRGLLLLDGGEEGWGEDRRCMRAAGPEWRPDLCVGCVGLRARLERQGGGEYLAAAKAAAWFARPRLVGPRVGGGSFPASLWTAT